MLKGNAGERDESLSLLASQVDTEEMLELLTRRYSWSQSDPKGGVFYPSMSAPELSLSIDESGLITEVRRHRRGTDATLPAIEAEIRAALVPDAERQVHSALFLAGLPVSGFYRAPGSVFQISPAPPDAPRPPAIMGDHPFVFQYQIVPSSDDSVTRQRSHRAVVEWIWFLNGVLGDRITLGSSSGGGQAWVHDPSRRAGDTTPRASVWAHEGYWYPDWQPPRAFLALGQALPEVDAQSYYGRFGSLDDRFDLPATMGSTVERYMGLSASQRVRFLRAAQWVTAAIQIAGVHRASAVIAQVAAIETLAFEERTPDICPVCGSDGNLRPTKRFVEFVENHAPGLSRTYYQELYDARSDLVHGRIGLHRDAPFRSHTAFASEPQNRTTERLSRVTSAVMINWLRHPTS